MKKLLLFLIILTLYSCKGTQPVQQVVDTNAEKKVMIISQTGIEDLGIKEIKKSKESDWYKNFSSFRENYKQIKLNSDVFLGISGVYLNQEEAMNAARINGEANIKNSLAISSSTKESFGNIIDSVLEIHKVKYNGEVTTGYKYNLLLEVNKVSAFQVIDEKNKQIEEAKQAVEKKLRQAEEYEVDGDIALKTKSYAKAIIHYKNAQAIYEETDSVEQEEKVREKI